MLSLPEIEARPELLLGPNPFIESLPPFVPLARLAKSLACYPMDNKPWQSISPHAREALLEFSSEHYVNRPGNLGGSNS